VSQENVAEVVEREMLSNYFTEEDEKKFGCERGRERKESERK